MVKLLSLGGLLASAVVVSGCACFSAMIVTAVGVGVLGAETNAPKYELTYSASGEMSSPNWGTMQYEYSEPVDADFPKGTPVPDVKSKIRFSGEKQARLVVTILRQRPESECGMLVCITHSTVDYSFEGLRDEGTMDTLDWGPFVRTPLYDDLFCDILVTFGTGQAKFRLLDGTDPDTSDGNSTTVQRFRIGTSLVYRPTSCVQLGCGVSAETMVFGSLLGFSMGPAEPVRGFFGGDDTSLSLTPHVFLGARW